MKYFQTLKTSERIALSFSLFGFFSLLLFLILINITYFFIWYADQKEMSFSSMNQSYQNYLESEGSSEDIEGLKNYLLGKDTIIIPEMGELVCSPGVAKKIHEDPNIVKDRFLYTDGETIYFIYSKYFQGVGEVKVFFDTTPYINSQIIIIKTGLIFIFIVFILQFFGGKIVSRSLLKNLKNISEKVKNIDIHGTNKHIICNSLPDDDEIKILAQALNTSYETIDIQTEKLKQFLTDVSHEFKTPLMVMNSKLDVIDKKIQKNTFTPDDIATFSLLTRRNIAKMNELLETLFFLSRVEQEAGCLVTKPLKIEVFLEKKMQMMQDAFLEKNIHYHIIADKNLSIDVEQQTFSILLDNILSNAIKFSHKKVTIEIHVTNKQLVIRDNGIGIEESEKEKIWTKFYKKDTNKEGFGIGLYIVKRIINLYAWDIDIESKLGKGTTFIINMDTGKKYSS